MDWTLAMALEAGVWGKAGWLALHSHSEGFLPLPLCPSTLPLCPLKSCIQCVESPASGCHHVCVLVCPPRGVCACVCLHTRVCVSSSLPPSGSGCHFWLSALSPATSVPQPERGDALGCPHIWAPGPQLSCPWGQSAPSQFSQSEALGW